MVCERCGSEIEDNASICSGCGSINTRARNASHQHTNYGHFPQVGLGEDFSPQQGYRPQTFVPPTREYAPPPRQEHTRYRQGTSEHHTAYNYNHQNNTTKNASTGGATFTNKNNSALIAEIIFSLIGLMGIGWIIAGETVIGVILLLCSIFIYWPIMILGTIFTLGYGLICLGPISIAGIIINTLALNAVLNRKATSIFVPHKSHPPGTPPPHPY
jgi:hypothetical protein